MSMRWMKLEAQTSVPHFYFLLFILNKVKIVFFCLFPDLSVQYKNILKIKVLRMPCQFNMIFSGIFEDLLYKNYHGRSCHLAMRVVGAPPLGCAPCLVGPWWPSYTYPSTHLLPLSHTNPKNQLKHEFQPLLLRFSISLLKAPLAKLLGEIVPWYVTPPLVQLVLVLVLYSLQIFAA